MMIMRCVYHGQGPTFSDAVVFHLMQFCWLLFDLRCSRKEGGCRSRGKSERTGNSPFLVENDPYKDCNRKKYPKIEEYVYLVFVDYGGKFDTTSFSLLPEKNATKKLLKIQTPRHLQVHIYAVLPCSHSNTLQTVK
jgi:hypothetical protein